MKTMIGIVVVVALAGSGAAAFADTPVKMPSPGDARWMINQELLDAFDAQILDVVDPTEGSELSSGDGTSYGYAGLVNDPARATVTMAWVGNVPTNIRGIINSAPSGISVRIAKANYTRFQELEATHKVSANAAASVNADPRVVSVGPDNEGLGLVVEYTSAQRESVLGVADAAADLNARMQDIGGIPISEAIPVSSPELDAQRWADSGSLSGGSGYSSVAGVCSTGFPVQSPSTGSYYLLTAWHCFRTRQTTTNAYWGLSASGTSWGYWGPQATRNFPDIDTTLIYPNSQLVSNSIFTGAYNSTVTQGLNGFGNNVVGDLVYTDGAMTGVHGVIISWVVRDDADAPELPGQVFYNLVEATANGSVAVGHGDSGGPVYSMGPSGQHYGIGLIHSQYSNLASCGSTATAASTSCGSVVHWIGLKSILNTTGFNLY